MDVVEVAQLAVFAMLGLLVIAELAAPVRGKAAVIAGWRLKCLLFMPMIVAITVLVPFAFAPLIEDSKLLPGDRLGIAGGTVVGILVSELIVYWVHRLHHRVPVLWRWIHQLHHSAERMDVFGSAYFHPFEIVEGNVVGVLLFNVVLGLSPEAAALSTLWQAFAGVFQHGNIRTPVWLGYLIQRPESHGVHHERGIHGFNYSNLPLWDLLFGTFRNPPAWDGEAGFYAGSSRPVARMLAGHDIGSDPRV
jgi:sterol desaturase/sphingolipid hydroxylase (fatty acid hydroxylase superfamily)